MNSTGEILDNCSGDKQDWFDVLSGISQCAGWDLKNIAKKHFAQQLDDFLKNNNDTTGKCVAKSNQHRDEGNIFYKKRKLKESITRYNSAIQFAPDKSEALALAYGNRSAAYYHLEQYSLSIVDLDLAIENDYEKYKSIQKLLVRKCNCLIGLKRFREARVVLKRIEEPDSEDHCLARRLEAIDMFEDCYSPVPHLDDALRFRMKLRKILGSSFGDNSLYTKKIEMRFKPSVQRYVVAKEDIEPGDVLLVERAYCSVLLAHHETKYCHHCCRSLDWTITGLNSIPCANCVEVMFCSVKCRDAGSKYHRYECGYLPLLHQMGIGHLALRIFLSTDMETALASVEKYSSIDHLSHMKTEPTENLTSTYDAVYCLHRHLDNITPHDQYRYSKHVCMLLNILKHSGFDLSEHRVKIGNVLLLHVLQMIINAHSIQQMVDKEPESIYELTEDVSIASALFPSLSMINHSCRPNVYPTFEMGTFVILRASRPIPAGSEVFACYGYHYATQSVDIRRNELYQQYNFECRCSVCMQEMKRDELLPIEKLIQEIDDEDESPSSQRKKILHEIDSKWDQIDLPSINGKLLRKLARMYDGVTFLNVDNEVAIHLCEHRSIPIVELLFGSVALSDELFKLSTIYFSHWKVTHLKNKPEVKKSAVHTFQRCITLMEKFSPITDEVDSCNFKTRLTEVKNYLQTIECE